MQSRYIEVECPSRTLYSTRALPGAATLQDTLPLPSIYPPLPVLLVIRFFEKPRALQSVQPVHDNAALFVSFRSVSIVHEIQRPFAQHRNLDIPFIIIELYHCFNYEILQLIFINTPLSDVNVHYITFYAFLLSLLSIHQRYTLTMRISRTSNKCKRIQWM